MCGKKYLSVSAFWKRKTTRIEPLRILWILLYHVEFTTVFSKIFLFQCLCHWEYYIFWYTLFLYILLFLIYLKYNNSKTIKLSCRKWIPSIFEWAIGLVSFFHIKVICYYKLEKMFSYLVSLEINQHFAIMQRVKKMYFLLFAFS